MHRLGHIRDYWSRLPKRGRKASIVLAAIGVALLVEVSVVLASAAPPSHHAAQASVASAPAHVQALASHLTTRGASGHVLVGHSLKNDTSRTLRAMRPLPMRPMGEHEALQNNPMVRVKPSFTPDEALRRAASRTRCRARSSTSTASRFPASRCNCAPPDTNGEVGATQYVQMVNEGFQVFNKTTGASMLGPLGITTLWTGFGGVCETTASATRSSSTTSSPTAG